MAFSHTIHGVVHRFDDLKTLLAKASARRSGDELAGLAAHTAEERVAAQMALADLPVKALLSDVLVEDEVTRLIFDEHDAAAFAPISHLTVGELRDWLLTDEASGEALAHLAPGLIPEIAAAVSKLMRVQDLIAVAAKIRVVTRFRTTVGLPGRLSTRLQPNHPTDDPLGITASILDGLLLESGDAVIGINPVSDSVESVITLLRLIDGLRTRFNIPAQSCVLAHVTTQREAMRRGAPVDLVFQSIAGTEAANASFGVNVALLEEAWQAARELKRGEIGDNVMYFETGQGSALSANAHHGIDQQTCEARAYGLARHFRPMLVNTVVGFIGPEYLYDGKQITRAGLEDHFCGKLLGLPMGCDVCYTNHAEADQDDMDALLTLLGNAGVNYIMGVPGADDVMLNYQSTSFHDALYLRALLGLRPAPEFEAWLERGRWELPRAFGGTSGGTGIAEMKRLRDFTMARVALGRAGNSVPVHEMLAFQLAHARARDAVYFPFDAAALTARLGGVQVRSRARDRAEYLRRPDLGRSLHAESRTMLTALKGDYDAVFVVCDGLSALAVERSAAELLGHIMPRLEGWKVAQAVVCEQGRVAIGDEIGETLDASLAVVLIGERPGLSAADSMGVYLTWAPRAGRTDAERNCISNIRPEGLSTGAAAELLLFLMNESRARCLSGVRLKAQAILTEPSPLRVGRIESPVSK